MSFIINFELAVSRHGRGLNTHCYVKAEASEIQFIPVVTAISKLYENPCDFILIIYFQVFEHCTAQNKRVSHASNGQADWYHFVSHKAHDSRGTNWYLDI